MYPMAPTREWPAGRAILDRRITRIDDFETEPGLHPAMRSLTVRSSVLVPLMRGSAAIGALALGSRERGGFSDSQIELMTTFAEQAVIAITSAGTYRELKRRTGDLQESLEHQTATSDVLKIISRSTFDLQSVLNTLVESATRLCDADMASINRQAGDKYRQVASYGYSSEFSQFMAQHPIPSRRGSIAGRTADEQRVVHVADVQTDPEYEFQEGAKAGGLHTMLGVPLLREGSPIGVIALSRT